MRQFAFLILLKPVPIPSAYWRHGRALLVHRIYSDPLSSIPSSTIYMDSMIAIFAGLSSKQSAQSLQTALPKSAFFKFHPLLDCLLKVLMVSFKIPFGYIWLMENDRIRYVYSRYHILLKKYIFYNIFSNEI